MMMAQLRYFPISVELKVRYFVEKLGIWSDPEVAESTPHTHTVSLISTS
jgi:hypothetical protein